MYRRKSKSSGEPWSKIVSDWFRQKKTIKVFLIRPFKFAWERLNVRRVWRVSGIFSRKISLQSSDFTPVFRTIYPRSWKVFRSAPCALSFLMQATTVRSKRQASPLFTTGERLYRLIFLTTLFLTLITSSQVCSHLKLSTIGSCAAIESFTCQCARLIVLKNLLLLAIA